MSKNFKKELLLLTILLLITSLVSAQMDYKSMPPEKMCSLPEIVKGNEERGMSFEECVNQAKEHQKLESIESSKEMKDCIEKAQGDQEKMFECGKLFHEKPEVKEYYEKQQKSFEQKLTPQEKEKMMKQCLDINGDKEYCKEPWKAMPQKLKSVVKKPSIVEKQINAELKIDKETKKADEENKKVVEERKNFEKELSENENLFIVLNIALKLESLKIEFVKTTKKISSIETFYKDQGDFSSAKKFSQANHQLNQLIQKIDQVKALIKSKQAELSKEDIESVKQSIQSIKNDLKKVILALL